MSCIACDAIKNQMSKIQILNYEQHENGREMSAYMENTMRGIRLHITDGYLHTSREIYFCPFCGKKLTK